MQIKLKLLLIVAERSSHINVAAKNLIQTDCLNRVFPVIHEHKPDGILLDHTFLGNDLENILRRLKGNPFYKGIKIYCYKSKPHTKVDDLLKTLGVQQFIYEQIQAKKEAEITGKAKTLTGVLKNVSPGRLALRFMN
jgi:hypothetical protein